ncbi:MAG: prepilin peptidase, partial [Gammaproteobacteria bacterium]|nr:prepilin peptidase [Gammaproteobacteria bacterium]
MSSATLFSIPLNGAYPQREIARESWLDARGRSLAGRLQRACARGDAALRRVTGEVNRFAPASAALDDAGLRARAVEIGVALNERGLEDELVFECFALVRELSGRVLGKRHFDVQVYAAWVLLHGNVAEMNTGEGKTLTATLAVATAALAGIPTHVVTVNDYLVERDAQELKPLYQALGLSVGTILEGMDPDQRRAAYACDITYCTNKELVFDFLKDRITLARDTGGARLQLERVYGTQSRTERLLMRGLHYAIVDEADSALIDEARVPVIISRTVEDSEQNTFYEQAIALARELERDVDYLVDERERRVQLTEQGRRRIETFAADKRGIWNMTHWREAGMLQALSAMTLYLRDQHYLVVEDAIHIIDEFTGRTMPDRSWEMGLHQLVEAKEGVPMTGQREPLAKISYQRFFRRYLKLAGMSGTLSEVAPELWDVYRLHTVTIPTNKPCLRRQAPDAVFATAEAKWQAILAAVIELHGQGRPVLIGTR